MTFHMRLYRSLTDKSLYPLIDGVYKLPEDQFTYSFLQYDIIELPEAVAYFTIIR